MRTGETKVSCQDINDALSEGRQLGMYTVYIKGTATQVSQMLQQEGRVFNGTVKTEKREYRASFCVKRNTQYMQMIEELYGVFGANFQPWSTVCTAYLSKLVDVYLCSSEQIRDNEEIDRIQNTYDALNQLDKVQYPSYMEELYYDRVGNRTRRMAWRSSINMIRETA